MPRIPPLLRTILVLTAGVSVALYGLAATDPDDQPDPWTRISPDSTRGCPGLDRHVAMWSKWLEIPPWKIEAECGMPLAYFRDNLGLSANKPERGEATIWVRDGLTWIRQHYVVVHELVHIGIAAGRWKVPAGRDEEDYVQELADDLFRETLR